MSSITKAHWDSNIPIYEISFSKLRNYGINCLLIDVDGTLLSRQSNIIPSKVKIWIKDSKKFFSLYLISNNPSERRIAKIGNTLGIKYKFNAFKPSKRITLQAIEELNIEHQKIAIIGDRILTDILVGNKCDIYTILVKKISKKGVPARFNFILSIEKLISFFIF